MSKTKISAKKVSKLTSKVLDDKKASKKTKAIAAELKQTIKKAKKSNKKK